MSQFVGPREVESISPVRVEELNEDKVKVVDIVYKDKSKETLTKALFDASVTKEVSDYTKLLQQKTRPVIKEILQVLLRWGVKVEELQYIFSITSQSVNQSIQSAESKLWDKDVHSLTLIDVDKVLKTNVTLDDILKPPVT